jgi:hypothetical protein
VRNPLIFDQRTAIAVGIALSLAGSLMLWDAYDRRGERKPFALRVLGLIG